MTLTAPLTRTPALEAFRREMVRRNLSQITIQHRFDYLKLFFAYAGKPWEDVTQADILNWLSDRVPHPRTQNTYLDALRAFGRFCVDRGYRSDDPSAGIPNAKTPRLLPRPIKTEDLHYALAAAPIKLQCWISLAAFEGLRAGEIAHLHREDIHDQATRPFLAVRGKGDKERVVPLNAQVEHYLRRYGLPRQGYFFMSQRGQRPVTPAYVSRRLSMYFSSLNIDATAHQLRHYFASTLYAMTKDIRIVQEMLGHSSPNTTAIYVAYDELTAFEAVRSMNLRSTHPTAQVV